jgi:hypothetical protein
MTDLDSAAAVTMKRRIPALVILLSLGPVLLAQRDLRSRPNAAVRGPKLLWRLGSANALGALAYLRWGRR